MYKLVLVCLLQGYDCTSQRQHVLERDPKDCFETPEDLADVSVDVLVALRIDRVGC